MKHFRSVVSLLLVFVLCFGMIPYASAEEITPPATTEGTQPTESTTSTEAPPDTEQSPEESTKSPSEEATKPPAEERG